ncbi:MAG: DNA topoisomerase [Promethearchaeota archaeon]
MSTLVITEKNKVAEAIANTIGPVKKVNKTKSLVIYSVPSKNIHVLPLRGHILEYRNTIAFKSWTKTNPREIITNPDAIEKVPISYAGPYIQALKEYSKNSNHCIIATDADIEGCNIGLFDALPFVKQVNPHIKISQLWLSSLQRSEIFNKLNNLVSPKYSWGESGEARAIIDAFIGFSATREVTNTLRPLLNKFNIKFTSIGRVQTSLLYLIYLRENEIIDFIPEPYYLIDANLVHNSGSFKAHHQYNPFSRNQQLEVRQIYEKIKNEKYGKIIDNSKVKFRREPPTPLNTSKALILLTKNLRISANLAMRTMSALYLNKIISYPRTDSDVYKNDFNHVEILHKFSHHSQFNNYVIDLFKNKRINPTKGKKDIGDHPPITPLEGLEIDSPRFENNVQKKVYDILARHYLALFGEPAIESKQKLMINIKGELFIAKIVSLISLGFLEVAPFLKPKYESEIQIFGNEVPVKEILLEERETKPPPKYTDTSLLKLMEKNNLGTKSTRPIIINLLLLRKLINRMKNRYSITDLGKFLILNLIEIWLPFLVPDFTKGVEEKLEEVKNKRKTMNIVIKEVRDEFLELFDKFLFNKSNFISRINNFKIEYKTPITTSNCPFCESNPMKFINTKKNRFLVCSDENCKQFLSLPKNGKLELLNSTCSICNFNIFKITLKKNNKPFQYYICPKCWNANRSRFCSNCSEYKISKDKCIKK